MRFYPCAPFFYLCALSIFAPMPVYGSKSAKLSWVSPAAGEEYDSGATLPVSWRIAKEVISPSFQLCAWISPSSPSRASRDEKGGKVHKMKCGARVWPSIAKVGKDYSVSLFIPEVSHSGNFTIIMASNSGSKHKSPKFRLNPSSSDAPTGSSGDADTDDPTNEDDDSGKEDARSTAPPAPSTPAPAPTPTPTPSANTSTRVVSTGHQTSAPAPSTTSKASTTTTNSTASVVPTERPALPPTETPSGMTTAIAVPLGLMAASAILGVGFWAKRRISPPRRSAPRRRDEDDHDCRYPYSPFGPSPFASIGMPHPVYAPPPHTPYYYPTQVVYPHLPADRDLERGPALIPASAVLSYPAAATTRQRAQPEHAHRASQSSATPSRSSTRSNRASSPPAAPRTVIQPQVQQQPRPSRPASAPVPEEVLSPGSEYPPSPVQAPSPMPPAPAPVAARPRSGSSARSVRFDETCQYIEPTGRTQQPPDSPQLENPFERVSFALAKGVRQHSGGSPASNSHLEPHNYL
ncbi:hypothetical protein BOTBODRAFT_124034 [Botryobasidium botryosum FD-172 SS1]|uniref:Uncharacterized protein n=1 Tax=Botryobasidium botryosum (strain FD-172 SS1) TaxID=930990 RepID=A0A067MXG9_BOTB1|nr:hypothetical protein BOTBODRAFT_124034 [Botryobasidium botryosum FD-172 SS1]